MESSLGKIGAFAIRWDPIVTWEHGVAWRTCHWLWEHHYPSPIGSMYGIYTNIGGILMVNVTIYGIHGSYGSWSIIIPWFTRHFPIIFPWFTHHVVSFTMPISFPAPSKRLQRRDRCDTRGSRGHRNADARVSWVLFKVFVCFSNRKSTIWGIYSEHFLFFWDPESANPSVWSFFHPQVTWGKVEFELINWSFIESLNWSL